MFPGRTAPPDGADRDMHPVRAKLGVIDRAQAVAKGIRRGVIA
ncbi:MAG: hypothetical protein WBG11_06445 [Methylocella sp.]